MNIPLIFPCTCSCAYSDQHKHVVLWVYIHVCIYNHGLKCLASFKFCIIVLSPAATQSTLTMTSIHPNIGMQKCQPCQVKPSSTTPQQGMAPSTVLCRQRGLTCNLLVMCPLETCRFEACTPYMGIPTVSPLVSMLATWHYSTPHFIGVLCKTPPVQRCPFRACSERADCLQHTLVHTHTRPFHPSEMPLAEIDWPTVGGHHERQLPSLLHLLRFDQQGFKVQARWRSIRKKQSQCASSSTTSIVCSYCLYARVKKTYPLQKEFRMEFIKKHYSNLNHGLGEYSILIGWRTGVD